MPQWLEIAIRSFSIIIGLFIITKLLGKKQLSKLSFFEYIVGITIGDIAGTLSMDPDLHIKNGVTSILIWSLFPLVTSRIAIKSKRFRDFIDGNATIFVRDGKILEKNLRKEKYTIDEFLEQIRKKNIFSVDDIEFSALESNGDLSVMLKKEKQPATYGDLYPNVPNVKEPKTVIMDGEILDEPLGQIGMNRRWLEAELEKRNLQLHDVFLAQVDSYGEMKLDLINDSLEKPQNKEKQLTFITLEKCVTDFGLLAITSLSNNSRILYQTTSENIEVIKNRLRPLLKD
ncbi:DUF421 domain-containing protein [Sutcliffiella rhizosphaerae]|uniref:YetF C-terminal domain-containing protein n=1 Tax=Sutcliffiella rhizosphaerae TaxID=2880967 RepID=A0ABN8ACQ9_9BACI|nr:DUF421 domain-containing protein [Sutcliffiella rhizosphaerae]CAG9620470.1 hypothetical protein BACCIP111883_01238 [Sutcliffiella rhizosphaerae]